MNGKIPEMKVIMKLISRPACAPSPVLSDTKRESSIKSALTRSAYPTFLLIAFRFILESADPPLEGLVFGCQFGYAFVDLLELVVAVEVDVVPLAVRPVGGKPGGHTVGRTDIVRQQEEEEHYYQKQSYAHSHDAGDDASVEAAVHIFRIETKVVIDGETEFVDILAKPAETRLKAVEIPVAGVDEVRLDHVAELKRSEHIGRIRVFDGVCQGRSRAEGRAEAVALAHKTLGIEIGKFGDGSVTYSREDSQIVLFGRLAEAPGVVDAVDILGDEVGDVRAHLAVFHHRDHTRQKQYGSDGAKAHNKFAPHTNVDSFYDFS